MNKVGRNVGWIVGVIPIFALLSMAATHAQWEQPPDAVLQLPRFVLQAAGQPAQHHFEVASGQLHDRWIRALQFQPCEQHLVQSANFYIDKTGQWLGIWTPSQRVISFPETVAAWLPAGAKLIADVHYLAVSRDVEDCSSIGLNFTERRPLRPLEAMGIQSPIEIPSGSAVELRKEFTVIADSYALGLQPETKGDASSVEVTAVTPSGSSQLLYGNNDFKSSEAAHVFDQPVFIPKGTRIVAIASYRNPTQTAAADIFKLTMSLYPSAEFRAVSYEAAAPLRSSKRTAASATKKTTSKKKSSSKKHY